ncbi:hypothetical protein, partial [Cronobacter sakazakii]|uniref:hypothetical protein n=1 Tax=Cronobacter sakazakii TaxID=28141 RepID=UPI00195D5282
ECSVGPPHARVGNCQASDKRKSLMRKHGAFLYAASVRLNASEQDKRLEADFHIAPGRSENSWQVGSPRLPNASEDNLLLFCCTSKFSPLIPIHYAQPIPRETFSPFVLLLDILAIPGYCWLSGCLNV